MSERRAKQRRRLERLAETGRPERHKVRATVLGDPHPGSWNPAAEAATRKQSNRCKDH